MGNYLDDTKIGKHVRLNANGKITHKIYLGLYNDKYFKDRNIVYIIILCELIKILF